jgi:hypothetical protein
MSYELLEAVLGYVSRRSDCIIRFADDIKQECGYKFRDIDLNYLKPYPPSHHIEEEDARILGDNRLPEPQED